MSEQLSLFILKDSSVYKQLKEGWVFFITTKETFDGNNILPVGELQLLPPKTEKMFPKNVLLANGRTVKMSDYPELYQVIGDTHSLKYIEPKTLKNKLLNLFSVLKSYFEKDVEVIRICSNDEFIIPHIYIDLKDLDTIDYDGDCVRALRN